MVNSGSATARAFARASTSRTERILHRIGAKIFLEDRAGVAQLEGEGLPPGRRALVLAVDAKVLRRVIDRFWHLCRNTRCAGRKDDAINLRTPAVHVHIGDVDVPSIGRRPAIRNPRGIASDPEIRGVKTIREVAPD